MTAVHTARRDDAWAATLEAHRRELHVHCYRMTGSLADAEDLTQEVLLRAWRDADRFEGRASVRTWLYRIATNACIDFLRSHQRRAQLAGSVEEVLEVEGWIDPYPDRADPAEQVAARATTDLHLTAALAQLPARQRAALIACDLLDLDARSAASVLGCSTAALNSALQRARRRVRDLGVAPGVTAEGTDEQERVVRAYVDAHERSDVGAIASLLAEDVRVTMPPEPPCRGAAEAERFFAQILGSDGPGRWQLDLTRANGTYATVNSVRRHGAPPEAISVDVLHIDGAEIRAIHCFIGPERVRTFLEAAAVTGGRR